MTTLGAAAGRGLSPIRLVAGCLALAAVVAGLHVYRPGLLGRIELAVYDRLLTAAPLRPPSDRLALVEIDERSLSAIGRWPWSRDRIARLVDRLRVMGVAAIGLDVIFAEPDGAGPAPSGSPLPATRPRSPSGTPPSPTRSGRARR